MDSLKLRYKVPFFFNQTIRQKPSSNYPSTAPCFRGTHKHNTASITLTLHYASQQTSTDHPLLIDMNAQYFPIIKRISC